jgi:hypothetical protein
MVSWGLIALKTKTQWPDFQLARAFASSQFPVFLGIDAFLIFFLVIAI